jgi:hypothetical protein
MDMVLANHNPSHPNEAPRSNGMVFSTDKSSLTPPRSGAPPSQRSSDTKLVMARNRKFESTPLQQRVGSEPARIRAKAPSSNSKTGAGCVSKVVAGCGDIDPRRCREADCRRMPVPTRLWSIGRSRYVPSAASAGRSRAITSTAECGRDGVRRGDLDDAVSRCGSATVFLVAADGNAVLRVTHRPLWTRTGLSPPVPTWDRGR